MEHPADLATVVITDRITASYRNINSDPKQPNADYAAQKIFKIPHRKSEARYFRHRSSKRWNRIARCKLTP